MNIIKRVIESLIAISVIPAIVLTVINVTELKDVRNVQFELLSEEGGIYNVTPETFKKLMENKRIKNYKLESNYPLITREEIERATWYINDDLKNEIFIDEYGQKRIRVEVGRIVLDGSENWELSDDYGDVLRFRLFRYVDNTKDVKAITQANKGVSNLFPLAVTTSDYNDEGFQIVMGGTIYINILKSRLSSLDVNGYKQWLQDQTNSGNPLTIWYELAVKNPNMMIIESKDLYITSDYVRLAKPSDYSNNPDGLLIDRIMEYVDRFEVTNNWIYVYPKNIAVEELANLMVGKTLYYELSQPRLVEEYDFSKFRLIYDKNRIRVVFDIDDEYYLWEITKDDKMIPINGQYDIGNVWTVKFYVYEIQQPLIRTLVLLIPLIVVSGILLYMFNLIKKKEIE